jgi:hypothetical protein
MPEGGGGGPGGDCPPSFLQINYKTLFQPEGRADYAYYITNPPPLFERCGVSAVSKVGSYFHNFVTKLSCLINSVLIRI